METRSRNCHSDREPGTVGLAGSERLAALRTDSGSGSLARSEVLAGDEALPGDETLAGNKAFAAGSKAVTGNETLALIAADDSLRETSVLT